MNTVGERVQRLREELGMTRTELASRVGLSSQAIAALENGVSKQPSFIVGMRLARVLRVRPAELVGLIPPPCIHFRTKDGKIRFDLVMMYRDADSAEITEWMRLLVDAIGLIPGFEIETANTADSTTASVVAQHNSKQMLTDGDGSASRIEDLDRRLHIIERDIRGTKSAKKSNRPKG
jgi:transcriptional regulator with XRE-family HTH domain